MLAQIDPDDDQEKANLVKEIRTQKLLLGLLWAIQKDKWNSPEGKSEFLPNMT